MDNLNVKLAAPDTEVAIKVVSLTKIYKLYDSPMDRLKEALSPIRKKYHRDFHALHDLSFDVKKGETIGIIGRNGSGKSTLLKLITGVLSPSSGSVLVNGKISALLELGAGFNPEMTGLENVYFNGALMGYSKQEMDNRLDNILGFADIGEFVHQPVKTYSSGMFVRLAFAVAINVDPDILIVDEALSVGDIKYQRKCFSKIEEFKEKQKTILFVSHDSGMISNLCNSAILLDGGKLITNDEPRIVSKMYMQLMYGENIDDGKDISFIDRIKDEDLSDSEINKNFLNERRLLRANAINSIGILSRPSSCELRHGNGNAEIINFGILDSNNNRVNRLKSGDKYTIFYYLLFYENVVDLFLAIAIRESQGINLFFTNTNILQTKVFDKIKGDLLLVSFEIDMVLAAGEYFMSCIAMDNQKNEYLDRRLDVFHFSVGSHDLKCKGFVNLMPSIQLQTVNYH